MLRIYKSSAGSGKTYTLVKEFLRLALQDSDPTAYRHILAITFTNKAANEMKARILKELTLIGDESSEGPMLEELKNLLGIETVELRRRAAATQYHILHHYSDLAVSTIDSFVNRLVRSFAYDLQLASDFEVELDDEVLLEKAVANLLQRISGEDEKELTRALVDFAEHRISEGKGWNIESNLKRFSKELFREAAAPFVARLWAIEPQHFRTAQKQLLTVQANFEKKVRETAATAIQLIEENQLEASHFYYGAKGIWGFFNEAASFSGDIDCLKPNSYATKAITENKWYTAKKDAAVACAAIDRIAPQLTAIFQQLTALREAEASTYLLSQMLLQHFYSYMLLTEVKRELQLHQKTEGVLHISEFQQRVGKIVSEQDAPIIYERIGDRYDQILIDEFQDTSLLQWRNLVPLIENSQFRSKDSLIVGDGKQAIYRFRGGEVAQFAALPQIYGSNENAMLKSREVAILNYGTEELVLNKNFRSRKNIIEFNNALFRYLEGASEFAQKHIYENNAQLSGKNIEGGYVHLEFLPEVKPKSAISTLRNEKLLEQINNLRSKGFNFRDIAILTRVNSVGSDAAAFLLHHKIPVVSSESLLIHQSYAVKTVLSVLQYLTDRNNAIKRAEIFYFIDEKLVENGKSHFNNNLFGPFWDFEARLTELLGQSFQSNTLLALRITVLVDQLCDLFGLNNVNDPFIQFFRDAIMEFAATKGNRISEFLDWWEVKRKNLSVIFPEHLDAVRIMSIHKSKGLQFPAVIFADADFDIGKLDKLHWQDVNEWLPTEVPFYPLHFKESMNNTPLRSVYESEKAAAQLDMINMVYVAVTRAEEALVILGVAAKKEPEHLNSVSGLFVQFLKAQQLWMGFEHIYEWGEHTIQPLDKHKPPMKLFKAQTASAAGKMLRYRKSQRYKRSEPLHFGSMLHQLLASISSEKNLQTALKKMTLEKALSNDQKSKLENAAQAIFSNEIVRPYFSSTYRAINERPILDEQSNSWQIPDRVLVHRETGNYVLIDFKTGEEKPAHEKQLRSYAELLRKTGGFITNAFLIYTATNHIKEISL
ncbi:MAG: UvrD-helicase domain-containing protein [Chitinophagales bacterium]